MDKSTAKKKKKYHTIKTKQQESPGIDSPERASCFTDHI